MRGPLRGARRLAGLVRATGCVTQSGPSSPLDTQRVVLSEGNGDDAARQQARFLPAVEALRDSVAAGRDAEARRILNRLHAMGPDETILELMDAFERILDGRALASRLRCELVATELADTPGDYRLALHIESREREDVRVLPAGARLRVAYTSVDPLGSAQQAVQYVHVEGLEDLRLEQDEPVVIDLVEVTPPEPTGMLALDAGFQLEFLATELRHAGRSLPVNRMPSPSVSIVRLAGYIPNGVLPPEELLRYIEAGSVNRPALMERTVRIAPAERERALDELAPLVARLPVPELEEIVPALRWLTGVSAPGGDAEAWREWMASRERARDGVASGSGPARGGLDLPRAGSVGRP